MKTKITFLSLFACFSISVNMLISQTSSESLTDIDGNEYLSVQIGNQIWMAKNLRVTKTPDGTAVNAYAPQDDESKVETFGRLYPWAIAKTICPSGWHTPSANEWDALIVFLGGPMIAGGKIKETGTTHWRDPNKGATNETGFTAFPVGYRTKNGKYMNFKNNLAYFWSSTDSTDDPTTAWGYYITYGEPIIYKYSYSFTKDMSMSVRCVKD
jgi:uncharacterized protein (TIGR02145 family)